MSVELTDPNEDPKLFEIVSKQMVHGPYGNLQYNSPCVEKQCSKHIPKSYVQETQVAGDGYPAYTRRKKGNGGHTANSYEKWVDYECGK